MGNPEFDSATLSLPTMKKDFREQQRQKAAEINRNKFKGCFHDKEHWCNNCIRKPIELDLRNKGLGKGYLITNNI